MNTFKAVIIDDERLARKELTELLAEYRKIEVVAEAANAKEGIQVIEQLQPDLLFLDIQMPEKSGFDLLEELDNVPLVVFVTAYDEYALKAFEISALDYIVKPIRTERLALTIKKVLQALEAQTNSATIPQTKPSNQIFIKDGDKCFFIKLSEINDIESIGNYARLTFNGQSALLKKSLNQIEERLQGLSFFRCNRSQIINLNSIDSIKPTLKGTLRITLINGKEVTVSERKSKVFKHRMSL